MYEFNIQNYENDIGIENTDNANNLQSLERLDFKELNENPQPSPQKKRGNKIFSFLAAATITCVATFSILIPTAGNIDKTMVEFAELGASDTSIYYYITLENRSEEAMSVVVYNNFTVKEQEIEGDYAAGEFIDLKPNMYYKIAVKKGNKIIAEKELKTMSIIPAPITQFRSVKYEYKDGIFSFIMDYVDENYYWYYFEAVLIDEFGVQSYCEFTDNPLEKQTIDILYSDIQIDGNITFRISCFSYEYYGELIILYETNLRLEEGAN